MKTLGSVGDLSKILSFSPIAQSPLWTKPLDAVTRYSLVAWVTRMKFEGKEEVAHRTVIEMLEELKRLHSSGEIPEVELLSYRLPRPVPVITSDQLVNGLKDMSRPYVYAMLFGIETGWDAETIISFRWKHVNGLGEFSEKAKEYIKAQPRHIRCDYVFWSEHNGNVLPVFGLEQMIFETFTMTWREFVESAREVIVLDLSDFDNWLKLVR